MSEIMPESKTERSYCGACERRKTNPAPRGTAESLALGIGAVSKCLNICNDYSIDAGVEGVNYLFERENAPDQKGTIVVDENGDPLPVTETYEPTRVSFEYDGVEQPGVINVQVNIIRE